MADTQPKPAVPGHIEAAYPNVNIHDTYAVGSDNEPITVLGTMGQDPDAKQHIPWTAWIIVFFCGVAMVQNTYIGWVGYLPGMGLPKRIQGRLVSRM